MTRHPAEARRQTAGLEAYVAGGPSGADSMHLHVGRTEPTRKRQTVHRGGSSAEATLDSSRESCEAPPEVSTSWRTDLVSDPGCPGSARFKFVRILRTPDAARVATVQSSAAPVHGC